MRRGDGRTIKLGRGRRRRWRNGGEEEQLKIISGVGGVGVVVNN